MPFYIISGLLGLAVMAVACELFANSVDWGTVRFNLAGTAAEKFIKAGKKLIPEIIIPLCAVIFVAGEKGQDISTGSIMGAPLVLSTLVLGIMGVFALITGAKSGASGNIEADVKKLTEGLIFFIIIMLAAVLFSFMPWLVKKTGAFLFLGAYIYFVRKAMIEDAPAEENGDGIRKLYFSKAGEPERRLVLLQGGVSVFVMAVGAKFFVSGIEYVSSYTGMPAFLPAILLSPAAVEMHELFYKLGRIKKGMGIFSSGRIAGSMTARPAVMVFTGLLVTDWILSGEIILSALFSAASALLVIIGLKMNGRLNAYTLLSGLVLYVLYVVIVFMGVH